MTFQRILFPIDFSIPCSQIAPCVAAMQQVMGASLALLHSIDFDRPWFMQDSTSQWPDLETLRKATGERLRAFAATHFAGTQADLVQDTGEPAGAISRCVEARRIDLVMMPTHGYGGFRRALLGSVTTKVLHDVNCAVWTASHTEAARNAAVKNVLCGIEDPESSAPLLRSAAGIAEKLGATLSIVHAYPDFAGTPAERYERRLPRPAEANIRRKLDALQMPAGTSAPVIVARGEVNDVIAETARRRDADLVIVGRGSFGGFLVNIRSHLYYIIRSSPCPVLVVPE